MTIENGEEILIQECLSFFHFVFHAKSGTKNNNRAKLNDIYHMKALSVVVWFTQQVFSIIEKNLLEIFDFWT